MENITETTDKLEGYADIAVEAAILYGPKVVLAIVTLIIGLWVINRIVSKVEKHFTSKADPTLGSFVSSLASVIFKMMLLIAVASMVGIETTSFVAVLGAAGLAVGLALQGSLSNFAGGVLILLFKPFKVGDLIDAQGHIGVVKEIQIFNTILTTADNRVVIIPNGALSNSSMVNINQLDTRRVDFVFGIGYSDDIDKAKAIIEGLITSDSRVLKDPEHLIAISELADSSVNFTVRVWTKTADYWAVHFTMFEAVKKAFDEQGISIPFPQQDVHMHTVQ
ncbi:mechanosensitive ion channel protein MscS [Oleiphilus sp. HI0081]|jgi:small conductance mechanosensitive channel|nr:MULTISPECIES: mechanosensitive ion channel domain-containing protein [unclassified Oleiphilus]KZY42936.1 mechanosensitive ion channel protein MscS [Oleiphilus sp. HI0050]KZY77768.1 mechanosensitive ion channel protein MscS [Oleiphilus sp. HI0068]KZY77811.1 mechanosensitive ion channel protein MscS [Oleiphilus sp. HI0069]KZY89146.1 mechanosensitive ion channel protein MscS [Oleiphilus sp. HI0072]KZZ11351.1 mechanosensitive ion channel protein MscS [Oleiphilus sp. HI0078]KZZ29665.1 mechanose